MQDVVGVDMDPHPTQWILSNIVSQDDRDHGLGGLPKTAIIERAGKKIGFIGLADPDWIAMFTKLTEEC